MITSDHMHHSAAAAPAEGRTSDCLAHSAGVLARDRLGRRSLAAIAPAGRALLDRPYGRADLILVIDDGTITEQGDHASLFAEGGLYAELYELQASTYRWRSASSRAW